MSSISGSVALGIFAGYFGLIIGLFVLLVSSIKQQSRQQQQAGAFIVLTLVSFVHTWWYMAAYMLWSFNNYEKLAPAISDGTLSRVSDWLTTTALFEEAWSAVSVQPMNWLWSEQLCLFTVGSWTVFLAVEGHRYKIKHTWAYMLLGQVVAISVASNLFYLAMARSAAPPKTSRPRTVSPIVWLSVLVSLVTIGLSPFTSERTFLPNLLVMHALLVLPLLPSPQESKAAMRARTLYGLVVCISAGLRWRTVYAALSSLPKGHGWTALVPQAWRTLHEHPAQSSIGWDIVWTTISFLVWVALEGNVGLNTLSLSTFGSIGVGAPFALFCREEEVVKAKP